MMNKEIFIEVVEYNEELRKLSSSFYCGNVYIDNFLKGNESFESDICKTFVMLKTTKINDYTKQDVDYHINLIKNI